MTALDLDRFRRMCRQFSWLSIFMVISVGAMLLAHLVFPVLNWLINGRAMDAQEALERGVITKIVPADALADEAMKVAALVGSYSPLALRLGIESMQVSSDMGFDEALEYLNAMRAIFFASEDLNEGATAFLEKRKPVWQGK